MVGIVGNVRQSDLASSPRPCVYFAVTQRPVAAATLVVRSRSTPAAISPQLEEALARVAPDVPGETMALSDVLASALAQRRFALLLLLLFAGLAVGLAAVGIYGVVAYAVVRRTRELGVRLALGAAPRQARNLVLRASLVPVAVGALGGLAGAAGLGRALGALLFDVRPWDPLTWLAAILTLLAAATLAAWLPARRAARLDPVRSLRAE